MTWGRIWYIPRLTPGLMLRERIWYTWMSGAWRSLNNLCVAQQPRTITLQRRSKTCLFFQQGLVICAASLALCLLSSPGEAASCPCFQWDTRTSSLREATGHRPAAVQPEIWGQITSLKPNTQTGTNCVWILSRLNFIVPPKFAAKHVT